LHFTSLPPAQSPQRALNAVRKELMHAVERWVRKIESTKTPEVRWNSIRVLRLLVRELLTHFPSGDSTELEKAVKNRVPDFERAEISDDSKGPSSPAVRRSIECPVEFRHTGGPAGHDASRTQVDYPRKE